MRHVCHLQDVSGGLPVQVQGPGGVDLSLYGMQIDLEQARAELRGAVAGGGAAGVCVPCSCKAGTGHPAAHSHIRLPASTALLQEGSLKLML